MYHSVRIVCQICFIGGLPTLSNFREHTLQTFYSNNCYSLRSNSFSFNVCFSLRACDEPFRISHYQLIHGIAHILLSLVASDLLSTRAWRVCMIDSGDRRATSKVLQSLQNGLRTRSRPSN